MRNLSDDDLRSILAAIGQRTKSKASACEAAQNFCRASTRHATICRNSEKLWKQLINNIFDPLIYDTFRDDDDPRNAFHSMCGAKGLADVVRARFVAFALECHEEQMSIWACNGNAFFNDGMKEGVLGRTIESPDELNATDYDRYIKLAKENIPEFAHINEWLNQAMRDTINATLLMRYVHKYENDRIFSNLVNIVFSATASFLLYDNGFWYLQFYKKGISGDSRIVARNTYKTYKTTLDVINAVGDIIGDYIVCIWEYESVLTAAQNFLRAGSNYISARFEADNLVVESKIKDLRDEMVVHVKRVVSPLLAELDHAEMAFELAIDLDFEFNDRSICRLLRGVSHV